MKQEGWFLCVYGRSVLYKATCKEHFRAGVASFQMEKSSLVHMKAAHCMIILHILFTLSQSVPLWLLGQEGPSAKDERRQPIFNRKIYPLSWLNPVGLFHQNSGLIAKINNRDMEKEAPKTIDMEGENTGKRTSFENKKVSGFWNFSLLSFKGCPPTTLLPPSLPRDRGMLRLQSLSLHELHLAGRREWCFLKEKPVISVWICPAWIDPT